MRVPVSRLLPARRLLRPVDRESPRYLELERSIADRGVLQSLLVRPAGDMFEVIDGMHRLTIAKPLGIEVPCVVIEAGDEDVEQLQVELNAIAVETDRVDYARRLRRILERNPDLTIGGLSQVIHKSPKWISDTLSLTELNERLQSFVARGEIPLRSAYRLAAIPDRHRHEFEDLARTLTSREFVNLAGDWLKAHSELCRQHKLDLNVEFHNHPYLRNLRCIQREIDEGRAAPVVLATEGCTSLLEAFRLGLRWATCIDKLSLRRRRTQFEAKQRRLHDDSDRTHNG